MPTSPSRCRRWLRDGKARIVRNKLNVFCIQLVAEPSGRSTQDVVVGIDPGKLFSGSGVQSSKYTLFLAHLILPFKSVIQKMTARRILRRARRGRRINRKLSYNQRSHRQKRFDNRKQKKLPPSIRANKQLELRVVKELLRIFPISHLRYEIIKARTENGKGRGFSPAMVGQKVMLEWLKQLRPTTTQEGWQTSILRQQLGLTKDKTDKSAQKPETHAHDGIALAASHFMSFEKFHTANTRGHHWVGQVSVTTAPFRVISRPNLYRRQLHFENPEVGGNRKRKGGTVTPFGYRSGDKVRADKAGVTYVGWIGGYTQTQKTKNVSVYDHNWRRIGQFSLLKVELLQRSIRLCVTA
ncbi:RRXRR domain-containing protein [Chroococcidiopsis sp. SAG 2025]|uniref:RRXRR domain-containing protein n=1 Tax=Chroococcidiopsis sp. SAG 2025 TaxID=171389 RepID=UPI0039772838